jgi:hypothetical protein
MKNLIILFCLLTLCLVAAAQNPLVGTWELVSLKAVDTAKNKVVLDQSGVREMKIITPTHYMSISHRVVADTLVFDKAIAGSIKVIGPKFIETPLHASNNDDLKIKTDFNWKVQGDKLTQSGTITLVDGKKIKLEELVFQRVTSSTLYPKNTAIGTWDQLSAGFTFENGLKDYHTRQSAVRFQIMTPSHFMQFNIRDNAFETAVGGTYVIDGGATVPTFTVASFKINQEDTSKHYIDQIVDGDIMFVKGSTISGEGKETFRWEDVYKRVGK